MTQAAEAGTQVGTNNLSFDKPAKSNFLFLLVSGPLFLFGLVALLGAVIVLLSDGFRSEGVYIVTLSIAGIVLELAGAGVAGFTLVTSKERAVQQCQLVAEKVGLHLDAASRNELIDEFYAESVFARFVEMLKELKPEVIPAGFFAGGENSDTRRLLIEKLWLWD